MSGSPCPKCREGKLRRETSRMVGNSRVAYLGCNRCSYNHGAVAVDDAKRPRGSVLNTRRVR